MYTCLYAILYVTISALITLLIYSFLPYTKMEDFMKIDDADKGDYYRNNDNSYMLYTGENWINCDNWSDLQTELNKLGEEGFNLHD